MPISASDGKKMYIQILGFNVTMYFLIIEIEVDINSYFLWRRSDFKLGAKSVQISFVFTVHVDVTNNILCREIHEYFC